MAKNLSNFVSLPWKLDYTYYHTIGTYTIHTYVHTYISIKFYYLSKSKKNKLKMFNMISKPHKKNMAFKSRLRLNISSCIVAFWSSPPFVRAKSCDFELIVPGREDWNLKKKGFVKLSDEPITDSVYLAIMFSEINDLMFHMAPVRQTGQTNNRGWQSLQITWPFWHWNTGTCLIDCKQTGHCKRLERFFSHLQGLSAAILQLQLNATIYLYVTTL